MAGEVFIAYSSRDREAAASIEAHLRAQGLGCFRDAPSIRLADSWVADITRAVDACHAVLLLVSRDSARSRHVNQEFHLAAEAGKSIIPVMLEEGAELSPPMRYWLAGVQHVVATPSLEAALPAIAEAAWRAVDRGLHPQSYEDEADVLRRANYRCRVDLEGDAGGLWTGKTEGGTTALLQGPQYVVAAQSDDDFLGNLHALPLTSEFVIEGHVSIQGTSDEVWSGFKFGENYPGDYYKFLLGVEGNVRIAKRRNKRWSDVIRRVERHHGRASGSEDVLRVVRKGPAIHIFANGLHAATAEDFDIRAGSLGLTVGKGVRAAFSGLRVDGISLDGVFAQAVDHWRKMEMRETAELLRYVESYAPDYKHADYPSGVAQLLREVRPDRRDSVLIAVGSQVMPQLNDGLLAAKLREEINRRGRPHEFRWAAIVTDAALLAQEVYLASGCALVSVGGPVVNKLTATLQDELPSDPVSSERVHVQHNIDAGERRVALWGAGTAECQEAVERFMGSGLLDRFLDMIWSEPAVARG